MDITLNTDQQKAIEVIKTWWLSPRRFLILAGEAGTGKAQPLDELVLTPTGFKQMGEINVGDTVYSEAGQPIKVLDTFISSDLDMYKVTFTDGTSVRCCKDHLWEIQTPKLRELKRYRVVRLADMLPNLVKTKTKHVNKYRIKRTKPVEFPEVTVKINPWELGYLLGNGSSFGNGLVCYINIEDSEELLNNFSLQNVTTHNDKWCNTYRISYDAEFKKLYASLGLEHILSKNKFVPNVYLYNSIEVRKKVLAGLLDSDGCCANNKCRFSTGSFQLALDVQNLVESLGGTASISSSYRKNTYEYTVQIRTPFNPFSLKRKALGYKVLPTDIEAHRSIANAEYLGKFTGKCLLVDNPTHLYLTKNYIVTHNTTIVKHVIKELANCKPLFTAPSNEACRQLEKALGAGSYEIMTTYAALGFHFDNTKEEKELISRKEHNIIEQVNLIIVDEASMLNEQLLEALRDTDRKVLFIGHSSQLPAVKKDLSSFDECHSVAFQQDFQTITLGIPERSKGNLYLFIKSLENIIYGKPRIFGKQYNISKKELDDFIYSDEGKQQFLEEQAKIICYSNKEVDKYNQEIRKSIFKAQALADFVPKDKILLTEPTNYVGKLNNIKTNKVLQMEVLNRLSANSKATVKKVEVTTIFGVPCFDLKVITDDGFPLNLYVPVDNGHLQDFRRNLLTNAYSMKTPKAKEAAFRKFHFIMSLFSKVKHSYAITTHRSQGMTIDNVFVNWSDISRCGNVVLKHKLLYVACSRAKDNLRIF